jgi:quercetin 2,3-dioxygenase
MSKLRSIEMTYKGPKTHYVGDGFKVSQYFPEGRDLQERFSPFILMDYNKPFCFEPSKVRRGVGAHPHRGFETVTIAYEGSVEHHDNKGNHGIIGPGDVQWMTAGAGVLHKEYHEKEFSEKGGVFHVIQLWVNLPKKYKMVEPKYQTILKESIGVYKLDKEEGELRVIAGEAKGTRGPADTFTKMNVYNVDLKNYGKVTLNEPGNYNTGLLVLKGKIKINEDYIYEEDDFVLFNNEDGDVKLESITKNSLAIVLSGEPIEEPIVSHGPFVMNTIDEIYEAYDDFRNNEFGTEDF